MPMIETVQTGKCKLSDAECEHRVEHENPLWYGRQMYGCGHLHEHYSFKVITEEGKDDVVQCEVSGYMYTA